MAYSDYTAYVYENYASRPDKEDAQIFNFKYNELAKYIKNKDNFDWLMSTHHGILGDNNIRVICHKYYNEIWELDNNILHEVSIPNEDDLFDFKPVSFEYKNHKFYFSRESDMSFAKMIEPDGTEWTCDFGQGP